MDLYLLRHSEAVERGSVEGMSDAKRPLTDKGLRRARVAGHFFRKAEVRFDRILCSPFLRAKTTAELVVQVMKWPGELEFSEHLTPNADPGRWLGEHRHLVTEAGSVLVVGHEPNLSSLAAILLAGSVGSGAIHLRKGGAIRIVVSGLAPAGGQLEWLLSPKLLEMLG